MWGNIVEKEDECYALSLWGLTTNNQEGKKTHKPYIHVILSKKKGQ